MQGSQHKISRFKNSLKIRREKNIAIIEERKIVTEVCGDRIYCGGQIRPAPLSRNNVWRCDVAWGLPCVNTFVLTWPPQGCRKSERRSLNSGCVLVLSETVKNLPCRAMPCSCSVAGQIQIVWVYGIARCLVDVSECRSRVNL